MPLSLVYMFIHLCVTCLHIMLTHLCICPIPMLSALVCSGWPLWSVAKSVSYHPDTVTDRSSSFCLVSCWVPSVSSGISTSPTTKNIYYIIFSCNRSPGHALNLYGTIDIKKPWGRSRPSTFTPVKLRLHDTSEEIRQDFWICLWKTSPAEVNQWNWVLFHWLWRYRNDWAERCRGVQ